MKKPSTQILDFCRIQLTLIAEREERLRKEIVDCKLQREFMMHMIEATEKEKTQETSL